MGSCPRISAGHAIVPMKRTVRCALARCSRRSSPSTRSSSAHGVRRRGRRARPARATPPAPRACCCSALAVFERDPAQLAAAAPPARADGAGWCETMSSVDLAAPGMRADVAARRRRARCTTLTADFNRMLERLEDERREAGRAVLRAQEQERSRIAQDLHDEVNQALTAILLRLSATIADAPPGLRGGAAGDPGARHAGDGGAAAPRAPAAPDRARRPRPDPRARLAGRRLRRSAPGIARDFRRHGDVPDARPTRSSSSSTASRRRASPTSPSTPARGTSTSSSRSSAARSCASRDDGERLRRDAATATAAARPASASRGMRERALLVGGHLDDLLRAR